MRDRILTGWNFTRVLYVAMGVLIIIQALMSQQWFGAILGFYFFSMGFFAFGCAAGNCYTKDFTNSSDGTSNRDHVEFGEVKNK